MIRNATPDDAGEIRRIYNFYIENSISTFEDTPIKLEEMISRIRMTTAKYPWLVYENNTHIGGFAYATAWKPRAAYKLTTETTVYVDHKTSGIGIGKKLYIQLLDLLKKYNFRNAIGSIALPNEKSIGLHEDLGFEKAGLIKNAGIKFGKEIDVGIWQKQL